MTDEMQEAGGGRPAGPGGTGAFDANMPTRGERHLGTLEVQLGGVTRLDVVAVDFDDDYQEAGALAAVRALATHARQASELGPDLQDTIVPDEHGPFTGELLPPEEGRNGGAVRITHLHRTDGEQ